jgi:superfamily II DNA/RNA helicase
MSHKTFIDLGVPAKIAAVLTAQGIDTPFPIQVDSLPDTLAGKDVLGRGKTGSGKTLAFSIPMVARLASSATGRQDRKPRGLVLAPTRELATQITNTLQPLASALQCLASRGRHLCFTAQAQCKCVTLASAVLAKPEHIIEETQTRCKTSPQYFTM